MARRTPSADRAFREPASTSVRQPFSQEDVRPAGELPSGSYVSSGGSPVRCQRVQCQPLVGTVPQEGQFAPKLSGGDHASHWIEAQAELILATYEARPAIFLHELRDALAEHGVQTSTSSLSRFFARHGITRKKRAIHAAEQAREDLRAVVRSAFSTPNGALSV